MIDVFATIKQILQLPRGYDSIRDRAGTWVKKHCCLVVTIAVWVAVMAIGDGPVNSVLSIWVLFADETILIASENVGAMSR